MDHLQVIWLVDQICLRVIWDQDLRDHLRVIWDQDLMDHLRVIWDPDLMDHLRVIWDQVVLTHYLDQVNLHLQVDLMDHLQGIWDHLQGIWDQDLRDQWDLHQMIWVKCILIWTMQEHIMDQGLKDLMDLLQELIWMVTVWLRLHHQMIHLMM